MRVLHVVPSYLPAWRYGGPIHSVHGLCRAMAKRGHDVSVATTSVDGNEDSDVPLGRPVSVDGVNVHYFASRMLRRLYYSRSMYRFMATYLEQYDLVHTHSAFLWPTAAAAHLARKARKPYVLSPRGMLVQDLISRRSTLLKSAWIQMVEKRNIKGAAAIHVTSRTEFDDLLRLRLEPRRIFEVPNGLDLPAGVYSNHPLPSGVLSPNLVLFLGRVSWKKGLDRLVHAMRFVPDADLVVAGNDDENYWPVVAKLAEQRGISHRVHYRGFVEGQAKWDLIRSASLLVLPSYSENFGNVILEAMAVGTPVVVTPEVGISTIVSSRNCGRVVSGDAAALSGALKELLSDEHLRSRLGANGRLAAREFSWDSVAEKMEREYLAILRDPDRMASSS